MLYASKNANYVVEKFEIRNLKFEIMEEKCVAFFSINSAFCILHSAFYMSCIFII